VDAVHFLDRINKVNRIGEKENVLEVGRIINVPVSLQVGFIFFNFIILLILLILSKKCRAD